jgi:hypothetical protein
MNWSSGPDTLCNILGVKLALHLHFIKISIIYAFMIISI